MNELKVSYRIKALIKCVEECGTVADIGCDHGFVPYFLLKNKVCKRAVLVDTSLKSLNKARKFFLKSGLIEMADFRQGNGLSVLKDGEADFGIIAGLGGMEIINILKSGDKGVKCFLLQPMKNVYELRSFLLKNNFKLERDFIIFDNGHFYDIIVTFKAKDTLTEAELLFGKDNIKNRTEDFIRFLNCKKIQAERILNRVNDERREELLKYLKLINELLQLNNGVL